MENTSIATLKTEATPAVCLKKTGYVPSSIFHSILVQVPCQQRVALILAKWFPIVDAEIQGCDPKVKL